MLNVSKEDVAKVKVKRSCVRSASLRLPAHSVSSKLSIEITPSQRASIWGHCLVAMQGVRTEVAIRRALPLQRAWSKKRSPGADLHAAKHFPFHRDKLDWLYQCVASCLSESFIAFFWYQYVFFSSNRFLQMSYTVAAD